MRLASALAVSGILVLAACGSSSSSPSSKSNNSSAGKILSTTNGEFGKLPAATGSPTKGGTLTYGIIAGSQPNFIFPITPSASSSIYNQQFQNQMFVPLYTNEISDRPILSFATSIGNAPVYTNKNKTVTINMKTNYKWADGHSVDAQDVLFFIDELKAAVKESPSNFGNYTPGDFPDNITSMSAPSKFQVVLHISKTYNPSWFTNTQLGLISPLPSTSWAKSSTSGSQLDFSNPANAKAIYDFLVGESKHPATFASNKLWQDVDGPFKLTSFTASTDANTMVPNPTYGGTPKASVGQLKAVYFASSTAMFNQLRSGTLNLSAPLDPADLPQVPTIERGGYHVWGYPSGGFNYLVFNFKDTTNNWDKIIGQLYIRQAIAHLQDQAGIIKGVYKGAAAPAYGPVPAIPQSAYVPSNAATNPYPFSTSAASQLLSSHGWKVVPNGTTTCQSPGTAANQCGAGIPKGQNLNITVPYSNDPSNIGGQVTALASNAKAVGINLSPVAKTFNYLISNYSDPDAKSNINKWQVMDFGGFTGSNYPTSNEIFNTTGSFNEGGYSDPKADALIKASQFSTDPNAVKTEAAYLTQQLPGMFEPAADLITAWKGISGSPDSFANLSQFGFAPQYWYVTK
jgi:peptide/nickel transport system substrate-binding protein